MEELKQNLIKIINESRLSAEAVYYIVKDVYRDVEDCYFNYLKEKEQQKNNNLTENDKEE